MNVIPSSTTGTNATRRKMYQPISYLHRRVLESTATVPVACEPLANHLMPGQRLGGSLRVSLSDHILLPASHDRDA